MNFYFLTWAKRSLKSAINPFKRWIHGAPNGNITRWEMEQHGLGEWMQVTREETVSRSTPTRFGDLECDITARCFPTYPETGVMRLRDAKVTGSDGWVFTNSNKWFCENTRDRNPWSWNELPRSFHKPRRLPGATLTLASDWGGNYAHFLLDCLGRYAVFLRAGFSPSDIDHIYCSKPPGEFAKNIMAAAGVPIDKVVFSDSAPMIQAEILLAPTSPAKHDAPPPWIVKFLRETLSPSVETGRRRLYVPRGGIRKVANEADLLVILARYGFECFDHRKDNPAELFSQSSIVVGPHGAGLVNALFCRPGTRLLELTPSDHCFPFYYTLAEAAGLKFAYLPGRSVGTREPGCSLSPFDFIVDPDAFGMALQSMIITEEN